MHDRARQPAHQDDGQRLVRRAGRTTHAKLVRRCEIAPRLRDFSRRGERERHFGHCDLMWDSAAGCRRPRQPALVMGIADW